MLFSLIKKLNLYLPGCQGLILITLLIHEVTWASFWISLDLSFLMEKMGLIIVLMS